MILSQATPTVTLDVGLYGHLQGPMKLTHFAERIANELSLHLLMIQFDPIGKGT